MAVDPPPDIVVEVVVTHPSVSKFPLCAELGIPEIWTYDGSRLAMYQLRGPEYVEIAFSDVLARTERETTWGVFGTREDAGQLGLAR